MSQEELGRITQEIRALPEEEAEMLLHRLLDVLAGQDEPLGIEGLPVGETVILEPEPTTVVTEPAAVLPDPEPSISVRVRPALPDRPVRPVIPVDAPRADLPVLPTSVVSLPSPEPDRREEEDRRERERQERERQERERLERERQERERLERERQERERLERERQERERLERERQERERLERERLEKEKREEAEELDRQVRELEERREQERLLQQQIREIEQRQELETQKAADVLADKVDGLVARQKQLLQTGLSDRENGTRTNVARMKFFLHRTLTADEQGRITDDDRRNQPPWLGSVLLFEPGGVNSGARATLAADEQLLVDTREVREELDAFVPARMPRRNRGEPLERFRVRLEAAQNVESERMRAIVQRLRDKAPNYAEANKALQDAYSGAPRAAEDIAKFAGDALVPPVGGIVSGCAWRCSWQLAQGRSLDQAFVESEARQIVIDCVALLIGGRLGRVAAPAIRWMVQRFPQSIRRAMGQALEQAFDKLTDPAKEACAEFIVDLSGMLKADA